MRGRLRQARGGLKAAVARFKGIRRRRQIGIPAFAVILALSVWAALERDVFEGILLLVAASGLLVAALGFAPNRPKLRVTDSTGHDWMAVKREPVRPIDEEAIVDEQEQVCREEMPRQPRPVFPPGHVLGGASVQTIAEQLEQANRHLGQPSDDVLREHLGEVNNYGSELREWLLSFEAARAECLRIFECELRIYEAGHASADHINLILRFPEGFELDEKLPEVNEQPKRPEFSYGSVVLPFSSAMDFAQNAASYVEGLKLHRTDDEPRYSLESGRPRIDYSLGHVNQAHYRSVPAFTLKAPKEPGEYEIDWELTADGLPKALTGTFILEFRPPSQSQPLTALGDLEAEGRQFNLLS